jgi:hypothetical protein
VDNDPLEPTSVTAVDTEPGLEARRRTLREIVDLRPGERLERLYLFEPVERSDVAFSLALVTKRLDGERLEMVAIGGRSGGPAPADRDFVRRARFPEPVLPRILEEFIDRGGVVDAGWREVPLGAEDDPLDALLEALEPRPDPA